MVLFAPRAADLVVCRNQMPNSSLRAGMLDVTEVGRLGKLTQEGAGRRQGRYSQPIRPGTPTTQDNAFLFR
jgi:hypothetical protein